MNEEDITRQQRKIMKAAFDVFMPKKKVILEHMLNKKQEQQPNKPEDRK